MPGICEDLDGEEPTQSWQDGVVLDFRLLGCSDMPSLTLDGVALP